MLTFHHPTNLFVTQSSIDVIGAQPRSQAVGVRVIFEDLRIVAPRPERTPSSTAVGGAVDLTVRPPRVQCGNHDSPGLLQVDCQATKSEEEVSARNRGDVRPCEYDLPSRYCNLAEEYAQVEVVTLYL